MTDFFRRAIGMLMSMNIPFELHQGFSTYWIVYPSKDIRIWEIDDAYDDAYVVNTDNFVEAYLNKDSEEWENADSIFHSVRPTIIKDDMTLQKVISSIEMITKAYQLKFK